MICASCIHKEVCYEKEEDRRALKQCSDYFNFEEELEKIKTEISEYRNNINAGNDEFHVGRLFGCDEAVEIINNHISELKGENNDTF